MENIPKWLLSKNKVIYYHENPLADGNDGGIALIDVLFAANSNNSAIAKILGDVKLSSAWQTDEAGHPIKKLKLDDYRFVKGGSIAIRRSPLLKQDGFHIYAIIGKVACENPLEYELPTFDGENIIEILLEDTLRSA